MMKPARSDYIPTPQPWPIPFFAHRGGTLNKDEENTLAAFEKALVRRVPGIEIDVHFIDGTVKVTHYKRLAAAKNVPIFEQTLDFIRLTCAQTKIPRPVMNIDLKSFGCGKAVAQIIKKQIAQKKWRVSDFIITAFARKNIKGVREKYCALKTIRHEIPAIACGIIGTRSSVKPYLQFAKEVRACSLNTKWKRGAVYDRYISDAHALGLSVYLWNVNTPEQMADAARQRVDGIITDAIGAVEKYFVVK